MIRKYFIGMIIFLAAVLGFTQERTGNIYGKVTDESKASLPGILITLKGDLIGQMTTLTDSNGNFRFLSLSPGTYKVKAQLEGFATTIRKGIQVTLGKNVTLTITLVPAKIQEEVVVSAAPIAIDSKATTYALNLTGKELQTMPTARDPWVILQLAPGVIMDRENVGGSESGQQSQFVSRGSGRSSSNWNLDGIDTTDGVSEGASSQYYDFDAFEEIQIQTAATDVTAFTAGVQINLVTKRGGNKLSGGGRLYVTDDSFQGTNVPENFDLEESKVTNIVDTGLNLGGPIVRDKLWFWSGFGYQEVNVQDVVGETITTKIYNFELKLNFVLGRHRIESFFNFTDNPKMGRISNSPLDAWESRYHQTAPKPIFKIQDEITISDELFLSLKASRGGYGFKLSPIGGVGGIAYSDDAVGRYWGTYRMSDYTRTQYFFQAMGNLFSEKLFGVPHEFKFGIEYKNSMGQQNRIYQSQRLRYSDYEAGKSRRAYIYRNSDYDYRIRRLSAFFQDSIDLGRLSILASLRYDRQWGTTLPVTVPATNVDWAGEYNLPSVTTQARKSNVIWNTFSPRLGIIWDIGGSRKTLAKLHFGIYGERYSSSLIDELASTYGYVYWDWDDKNMDELVQPDEIKKPRVRDDFLDVDPSEKYDPGITSPRVLEITAGVEHKLVEDFVIGGTLIYRKNYNDYWSLNHIDDNGTLRVPTPDDWVIGGYIPQEYGGYAWWELKPGLEQMSTDFTLPRPDYYTQYWGFEVSFRKRFTMASRWLVNGSFTYSDWKRFYPTRESYNDPTNHEPVELLDGQYAGYISSSSSGSQASMNPRWMAKMGFVFQLPWKINFGGTFIAREGYILPKNYVDRNVERAGIDDNPSVLIAKYGTHRLPTFTMLNLRLDKVVKISKIELAFSIDMFNVFNTNTTLDEEETVTNSNYGQILMYTRPRILRFGLRLNF